MFSPLIVILLILIPLFIQRKIQRISVFLGLLIGGVIGFLGGWFLYPIIAELIYGDLTRYSIRIDILYWTAIFTSLGITIGSYIGAKISMIKKSAGTQQNIFLTFLMGLIIVLLAIVFFSYVLFHHPG